MVTAPYGTSPIFPRGGLDALQRQLEASLTDLATLYAVTETRTTGGVTTESAFIVGEDVPCRLLPASETREPIADKPVPTTEAVVQFALDWDLSQVRRIVVSGELPPGPGDLEPIAWSRTLEVVAIHPRHGTACVQSVRCREVA